MHWDQAEFDVRCEWGKNGIAQLAPISNVVILVDVLSFSTCVEVATSQGAVIYPYGWQDKAVYEFAESIPAELAGARGSSDYSLSPSSMLSVSRGTQIVLPSPNGSALSLATGNTPTLTGCLRNSRAIAQAAMTYGPRIAVIPAGEQWPDGTIRPAFEDFIAAGAIISYLQGRLSPEAQAAALAYQGARQNLAWSIEHCGSGRELIERGFKPDVVLATQLNVSDCVPTLIDGTYKNLPRHSW
ncbi:MULTISPECIES: 2-phosphosulfolactate phosphatase [unclassified Leptolyngbya]|uniref:2-phosphosulfolactate phosphatase n=1 Tax=unclassified Leptolyngbya TaxID=2650499 RepID=UPI0016848E7C|nr:MULTISPECIES: 2-phosphosulfolactate phosphatase [unclassified Leptolyngbya]MBD1911370.1 2-phosphosulfolactate phosphatase [Leptolyngbya sp. FACHB-8]MBD2156612.1 2-phosphosulfolactate phosphatase [Leptolyngbya sp. FACHB-16]